jgi:hypothetical protein
MAMARAASHLRLLRLRARVILVAHTVEAHDRLPGGRLEIFDNAGHFPHAEQPLRFSRLLPDFVDTTAPAAGDPVRRCAGGSSGSPPGPPSP